MSNYKGSTELLREEILLMNSWTVGSSNRSLFVPCSDFSITHRSYKDLWWDVEDVPFEVFVLLKVKRRL